MRAIATVILPAILLMPLTAAEILFTPVKVDGPVHDPANQTYWFGPFSESASVADIDGDGDIDIVAGRNWYEAPNWIKHTDFRSGAETNGPEVDNNSEFALDVNRDGKPDIVASGWMRMEGAFWYENPGVTGKKWTGRRIHAAKSMEGVIHGDIDGDGDEDILVNHWGLQPGQGMTWLEAIDEAPWFVEHVLGPEGERHGNGLGDINMDGRTDIVTPLGWWEAPERPTTQPWSFHADFNYGKGASHPMLVYDCNGDGLNDIIVGSAHEYGLAWYEQKMDAGRRSFELHWVEEDHGGFHTMAMGDLNGDGRPDLVTGKRLYPHHGRDITAYEPLFVFWYEIEGGRFTRHILSYNHLPWIPGQNVDRVAPNEAIGVGMKINVKDMDQDGDTDVVLAGKGGLYVLYNQGPTPTGRPKQLLPPEDTYSSWVDWHGQAHKFETIFNGKDLSGWDGPAEYWKVIDGVLTLTGRTDSKMLNENYLWTQKTYGDFVLEFDYRIPTGNANSGVFIRTEKRDDPVQTGMEIQVGNLGDRPITNHLVGAIYNLVAARVNAHKEGEWNHYRITCKGPFISIMLNGIQVSEANLDNWTEARKNPDGSENKFHRPLKEFAREGYIGFQDHGTPAEYRNIRIKELGD